MPLNGKTAGTRATTQKNRPRKAHQQARWELPLAYQDKLAGRFQQELRRKVDQAQKMNEMLAST